MDFTLKTNSGLYITLAAVVIAFIISYFYYKKTTSEGLNKKAFTLIRFFSLLLIFFLFSSPVISFFKKIFQDPVNVYLIDNSQSLLIESRNDKLKEVLQKNFSNSQSSDSRNLYFLFSGNLLKEINQNELEKISYEGINNFETDLSSSISSLQDRTVNSNLSSVTIISDGILNEGGNPLTAARSLNVPINYFLTGDTAQKKDLALKNLFYNKTAFVESNVPVIAEINSFLYEKDIRVNLFENDKLIQTKEMKVYPGQNLYSLKFNLISYTEDVIKYKIEIEGFEDEITKKNNYQEFFIKFLNNKFKVLVLSGGPGYDNAYISEEIKKIKNFEATFLTQKSSDSFYENEIPDFNSFDSFILIGYPTAVSNLSYLNDIKNSIEKNKSSIIFFAGRNTDYTKLSVLSEHLPFKVNSSSNNESETGIKSVNIPDNDVFKNSDLISSINSFPDIFKTATEFSINPSAETFLVMTQNSAPALVIQNSDKNRSAAFLAYGLYKWRLNNRVNNSDEVLDYLLSSLVVSLTDKKENKLFFIETSKPVYSKFEYVKFDGGLLNYEIRGGEYIKVKISGENFNSEIVLNKKDNNYFTGELIVPENGIYDYSAELIYDNNVAGSIKNKFAVGENNYEYKTTRADNSVLNELSNKTGGINFSGLDINSINDSLKSINKKSVSELKTAGSFELNFNPYYLGIIIFLLCLEWFLRKRNSLP